MTIAALLYLALFALAAAMPRHTRPLIGTPLPPNVVRLVRGGGWALLFVSFALAAAAADGGIRLVYWFGLLPLLGATILLALTYKPKVATASAPLALAMLLWQLGSS